MVSRLEIDYVNSEKRCKKCGSSQPPISRHYLRGFVNGNGVCEIGICPVGEHLHMTCACGFSGIAPCEDATELGPPYMGLPPEPPKNTKFGGWPSWRSLFGN